MCAISMNSYDWDWSESEGKRPKPTPLPHMRLCGSIYSYSVFYVITPPSLKEFDRAVSDKRGFCVCKQRQIFD